MKNNDQKTFHHLVILELPLILESIFYKVSLKDHLMHLIIHGVLHLMGYDHNNIKSEKVMIKLEKKIIEKIGADCTTLNRKYDERN